MPTTFFFNNDKSTKIMNFQNYYILLLCSGGGTILCWGVRHLSSQLHLERLQISCLKLATEGPLQNGNTNATNQGLFLLRNQLITGTLLWANDFFSTLALFSTKNLREFRRNYQNLKMILYFYIDLKMLFSPLKRVTLINLNTLISLM